MNKQTCESLAGIEVFFLTQGYQKWNISAAADPTNCRMSKKWILVHDELGE